MPFSKALAAQWQARLEDGLQSTLDFWMTHSLDEECGGYFNNIDRDGAVYDTKKHVWLQARQVWMLGRLYNERESCRTEAVLSACRSGAEFLRKYAPAPGGRAYFCLSREGQPVKLQRKIFAECFMTMALSECAKVMRATDSAYATALFSEACDLFERVRAFAADVRLVGQEVLPGVEPSHPLNMPMIMLNVICELRTYDNNHTLYNEIADECVAQIMRHVHEDRKAVFETVTPNGDFMDTPDGRLLNPGHAIEAGWFLMDYATRYKPPNEAELQALGMNMVAWSLDAGWDTEHGGIFYFLDCDGHSPEQLEWSMKLWWPHNEAMIATLMAYEATGDETWWQRYEMVATYTMEHFSDDRSDRKMPTPPARTGIKAAAESTVSKPSGAWFGYLTREGEVSQRFIGGPYKGFFHVPRCLHRCAAILQKLAEA